MLQRKMILVALLLLLLVPTLIQAQSETTLQRVVRTGELRVGTSGNQPPFTVKSKDGELIGYEIDLAGLLAEAMGVKVRFIERPFPELLPALAKKDVDIVMSGMTITPERNIKFGFVGPYIVSGKSILTRASKMNDLDELEKLNQPTVTVAVLKNSTSQRFAERFMPKAKLVTVMDHDAGVKMVLGAKVDLMVADFPVCALSMLRHPAADLAILDEPLTIEPIGVALPADSFQMHNLINNYMTALQMTGILEELEVQWFEGGDWLIRLP